MPQGWIKNWPLADGSIGMTGTELWETAVDDSRAEATRKRNTAVQTLGNLTILTQPLNSAASNNNWEKKKPELLLHSLLPINQNLHNVDIWDETAIQKRGEELFQQARKLWPH